MAQAATEALHHGQLRTCQSRAPMTVPRRCRDHLDLSNDVATSGIADGSGGRATVVLQRLLRAMAHILKLTSTSRHRTEHNHAHSSMRMATTCRPFGFLPDLISIGKLCGRPIRPQWEWRSSHSLSNSCQRRHHGTMLLA